MTDRPWPFGRIGFGGQVPPLVVFADIISDNWDGAIPPVLPDTTAGEGYALSAQQGSAQFNGSLFIYGPTFVGANADFVIGDSDSIDSQFFINNLLQHINMRATDDPDFPDQLGIIDVTYDATEGRALRVFWGDYTGGSPVFHRIMEAYHDATPPLINFWPDQTGSGTPALTITPDGLGREFAPAYLLKEIVVFESDDTFTKADYDGLRAIRVHVLGGGGGGGGAVTTGGPSSGTISAGSGGGGGGYASSFLLAAEIDDTEAVTVGQGGSGNAGLSGNAGGDSHFNTIAGNISGLGGLGGSVGSAVAPTIAVIGANGGSATGGQILVGGGAGGKALYLHVNAVRGGGEGGAAAGPYGGGMVAPNTGNANGVGGRKYGGGGSGASNAQGQGTTRAGGAGAGGVVVVEIYT